MVEAQSRGQLDLQVRFLLDVGAFSGLVEIYDGDALIRFFPASSIFMHL